MSVTVAVVQSSYVLMDQQACLDKAVGLVDGAAARGAGIVVLPERLGAVEPGFVGASVASGTRLPAQNLIGQWHRIRDGGQRDMRGNRGRGQSQHPTTVVIPCWSARAQHPLQSQRSGVRRARRRRGVVGSTNVSRAARIHSTSPVGGVGLSSRDARLTMSFTGALGGTYPKL